MVEKVISRKNLLQAYRQVMSNQGSAGIDGMKVNQLWNHLNENRNAIVTAVRNGSYLPQPILGVAIPKRYCIREDWKKPDRRMKNLIRLGISNNQAYVWSRTRMGGWAEAQSPIAVTTVTMERLIKRGYESMHSYYNNVSPQLNEPLYTRSVRTVV